MDTQQNTHRSEVKSGNGSGVNSAAAIKAANLLANTHTILEEQVDSLKQELLNLSKKRLNELNQKDVLAARFAALFDVLPGGVIVLDTQGKVIECNPLAQDFFLNPLMGKSWREILAKEVRIPSLKVSESVNAILLQSGYMVSIATTSLADGHGQVILLSQQTIQHTPGASSSNTNSVIEKPLIAESDAMKQLLKMAERVALTDCSVLICGESGTGKEIFARYIHSHSARSSQPFIAINCAAIPETMLEAILFGHEKGSFTGASQSSSGKFEQANGGTLLLDEVSEMSPALQAKLLRVLQEKEVERVGGKKTIAIDVRIIATSNRNLPQAIADGTFREDLYYRLSVFPLHLPELSERWADIKPLAQFFLNKYKLPEQDISLSEAAEKALLTYQWPGNIRELENVIQRALVLVERDFIEEGHLLLEGGAPLLRFIAKDIALINAPLSDYRKKQEHEMIWALLKNGAELSRKDLAIKLCISERSLRYKLSEMKHAGYQLKSLT